MAESKHRAHPRAVANLEVLVKDTGGRALAATRIRNISLGGVFIETDDLASFGAELGLEFKVPQSPQAIRCTGLVMWNTKNPPDGYDGVKGMGLRLVGVGVKEMRWIQAYVDTARAGK